MVHLSPWNPSKKINLLAVSKQLSEPNSSSLPAGNSLPFTKIEGLYRTTELHLIKLALSRPQSCFLPTNTIIVRACCCREEGAAACHENTHICCSCN